MRMRTKELYWQADDIRKSINEGMYALAREQAKKLIEDLDKKIELIRRPDIFEQARAVRKMDDGNGGSLI